MKKIRLFGMLAATIMVAVMSVFTACNKDKDDDGGSSSKIVGTWVGADIEDPTDTYTIILKNDGTGSGINEWTNDYGKQRIIYEITYIEVTENLGKIIFKWYDEYYKKDETETCQYEIKGNTMLLSGYDEYTKKDVVWCKLTKK